MFLVFSKKAADSTGERYGHSPIPVAFSKSIARFDMAHPHGLLRGNSCLSIRVVFIPSDAAKKARELPAGPAPTMVNVWVCMFKEIRRGWDSNPRYLSVHLISSQAQSTTLTPLQKNEYTLFCELLFTQFNKKAFNYGFTFCGHNARYYFYSAYVRVI